jgi:hypothetical protein
MQEVGVQGIDSVSIQHNNGPALWTLAVGDRYEVGRISRDSHGIIGIRKVVLEVIQLALKGDLSSPTRQRGFLIGLLGDLVQNQIKLEDVRRFSVVLPGVAYEVLFFYGANLFVQAFS